MDRFHQWAGSTYGQVPPVGRSTNGQIPPMDRFHQRAGLLMDRFHQWASPPMDRFHNNGQVPPMHRFHQRAGPPMDRFHQWAGSTYGEVPPMDRFHLWTGSTSGQVHQWTGSIITGRFHQWTPKKKHLAVHLKASSILLGKWPFQTSRIVASLESNSVRWSRKWNDKRIADGQNRRTAIRTDRQQ